MRGLNRPVVEAEEGVRNTGSAAAAVHVVALEFSVLICIVVADAVVVVVLYAVAKTVGT